MSGVGVPQPADNSAAGPCRIFGELLKGGEDPPDWLVTLDELEDGGDCLLAEARYEVSLDPEVWETWTWCVVPLCATHTARIRAIGGVLEVRQLSAVSS